MPTDAISQQRAAEIRAAFASLSGDDKIAAVHAAIDHARNGDADSREVLGALLTPHPFVRAALLPTVMQAPAMIAQMRDALDPVRAQKAAFLRWAIDLATRAADVTGFWLDAHRAGVGAPVAQH